MLNILTEKIINFLKNREFISVATCDLEARPNAAPKFLLKVENNFIYLVDYTIGKTWENIRINPRVSMSFADTDNLMGYQINGSVEIIDRDSLLYDAIIKEMSKRKISLSVKRIIEGVSKGKGHKAFELVISDNFIIFKVNIEEVVEICPSGDLKREKL